MNEQSDPSHHQSESGPPMRERRLHLQAFDYWDRLRGDHQFPNFDDLKSTDLEPFKENCLLLDVSVDPGGTIRFIGDRIDQLIDAPVMVGAPLSAFPHATFATALVDQISDEQGNYRAVEFEFIEDLTDSRGILLPFVRYGDGQAHVQFVLVVANFRNRERDTVTPIDEGVEIVEGPVENEPTADAQLSSQTESDFEDQLMLVQHFAETVVHPDGNTRESLYRALANVYGLYSEIGDSDEEYQKILKAHNLKVQKRAPFTPLLKLVFGKNYDKTRLTEYAAALAYAVRQKVAIDDFCGFLLNQPGGIKGCVKAERAARRGESGHKAYDRQQKAIDTVRKIKPMAKVTLKDKSLKKTDEFVLVLARKKSGNEYDLISSADISEETLDAVIRRQASKANPGK
jgi:hypothetical protein